MTLLLMFVGYELWRIEVVFDSEPAGAVVRVDGRGMGLTPLTLSLAPGRHLIELTHTHYRPHQETLSVNRGDRLERKVVMASGVGRVRLLSNPRGAWVEINGERLASVTPTEAQVGTGPAVIRMGLNERRTAEKDVIVLADQIVEVTLELNIDPHGSLTVSVSPADARVSFPELDLTYVPGVRIPIGEQLIKVERRGYEPQQIRYDVRYGDNATRVSLSRALGAISVATRPAAEVFLAYDNGGDRKVRVDYTPGMRVPIGPVEVTARAVGYRTAFRSIDLTAAGQNVNLVLEPMNVIVGETFADPLSSGGRGPLMIVVPGGEFVMGDPAGPPSVQPARRRVLAQPFAMSVHEVSVAEYRRFADVTGRTLDKRLTVSEEPARYLSWQDAVAFADWLSGETGARYRLPTEAEWEYAARAGTDTAYSFGDDPNDLCRYGNLADQSTAKVYRQWDVADCDDGFSRLAPVGSYAANPFGLHDVHGNVTEWVLECGMPPYSEADIDGTQVNTGQSCRTHGVRGGSWDGQAEALSSARRGFGEGRGDDRGIRLLKEL